MEGEELSLHWEEEVVEMKHSVPQSQGMCDLNIQPGSYSNIATEEMIQDTDQMAAENLMYLAQDVGGFTETAELDPNVECVTEEVITDDWVIPDGQERVELPIDHFNNPDQDQKEDNDVDVPLPTDQDEYTAKRPWPCDFCSRRFRKKVALMNHMVAHQNDRPHACNLCGVRYVRKCDLMNHLKVHAFVPDNPDSVDFEDVLDNNQIMKPKKRGRRKKNPVLEENDMWENMTSARTQQWSRRVRSPPRPAIPPSPPSPPSPQSPPSPPSPPPPPADPSRPFVCRQCGVGFAREKALQSHSRIHGGESPLECGECGELCWSRDALRLHARDKHPHAPHRVAADTLYQDDDEDDDMDFRLSPSSVSGHSDRADMVRGPALFCQDCGVAFQRADLLRRHVAAAHSYKRHDSTSSTWAEQSCDVCGETFNDALQLLAHAEVHRPAAPRLKKMSRGRNNTSTSSSSRQFPCRECGKIFSSRSSQQIHVRIHTGERPYGCRFCWKAFADGGTLRKHERIHTGEKPYACAVCPRAFNQRVVLREHVRSHHSAPDRRSNGGPAYCCVVCERMLHTSAELVQHLIQHCDANTAMKRQPQTGPRKYKRRRKILRGGATSVPIDWQPSPSPSPAPPSPPSPSPPPSPPPRRRRRRLPDPPARPKMIHTEEPRPRTKQVRTRRPPRHPADDLLAIKPPRTRGQTAPSPPPSPEIKEDHSPPTSPQIKEDHSPPTSPQMKVEPSSPFPDDGIYKCEMCSLEFNRRDALLLHVPIHI